MYMYVIYTYTYIHAHAHTHTHTHTHTLNGILFGHKKERNLAICNDVVGARVYYAE